MTRRTAALVLAAAVAGGGAYLAIGRDATTGTPAAAAPRPSWASGLPTGTTPSAAERADEDRTFQPSKIRASYAAALRQRTAVERATGVTVYADGSVVLHVGHGTAARDLWSDDAAHPQRYHVDGGRLVGPWLAEDDLDARAPRKLLHLVHHAGLTAPTSLDLGPARVDGRTAAIWTLHWSDAPRRALYATADGRHLAGSIAALPA